jgi:GxxExxY protein
MAELIYKNEVYAIIGAAMEVYNQLGPGFSESIYQEAMEFEVETRQLPSNPQQEIYIVYKEIKLKQFFKPDFIFYDNIIVEIKALDQLTSRQESQLLNYLKATNLPVGVLINFGADKNLEWKRMVRTQKNSPIPKVIIQTRRPSINDPKHIQDDLA